MHIPDGFIDPKMSIGMIGAALAVLSYCIARVKAAVTVLADQPVFAGAKNLTGKGRRVLSKLGEQKIYKMGLVAALIFAAQMFNFPVAEGTSGHLIGGVLAVVLLGPFAGTLAVAAVVIIQALFYADGGLIVMGANVINMACIGALVSYYIYSSLKKILPEFLSIGLAAWFSVMLAAAATSIEIGLSGTFALGDVMASMLKVHAVIGLAEAMITLILVDVFRRMLPKEEEQE